VNISLLAEIEVNTPSYMYVPVLTIKYAETQPTLWSSKDATSTTGNYTVRADYTMDTTNFEVYLTSLHSS
jgi:hypothetical protein